MATNSFAGSSHRTKWTNENCIQTAFADNFPSSVKNIHIQKSIINRYLNFYLGGKVQKGLKVTDLAFAVISIMPQHESTESFIWESKHYDEYGTLFHLTPEDKLRGEGQNSIANENSQEHINVGVETNNQSQDVILPASVITTKFEKYNKASDSETDRTNDSDVKSLMDDFTSKSFETFVPRLKDLLRDVRPSTSTENVHTNTHTDHTYSDWGVPQFPSNLQWFSRWPDNKVIDEDMPYYGPAENSAFIASCNKLLEQWDTNVTGRIVLKYLFGIIALVTMRATTKKYTHLVNTYRSRKFLTHIDFADAHVKYSIPHKRFVKNSYRTFAKRDCKIPVMFAKIVLNSFHIDSMRRLQLKGCLPKLNVFKLTVLSHTADYGFGLVTMLQNIESKIGAAGVKAVLKVTHCDITAESWSKLIMFLKTYMTDISKEATHHWARVISTHFFEDLTCAKNYALSVILGVFIQHLANNHNIWQSAWVTEHPENIEELKVLGDKMFKKLSEEVHLETLVKEVEAKKGRK